MKTPEEYFMDNVELPDEKGSSKAMTTEEAAFMEKYMGVEGSPAIADIKRVDPRTQDDVVPISNDVEMESDSIQPEQNQENEDFDDKLKAAEEVRLVSFLVGDREYALPIVVIQEVVKKMPVTVLPSAPEFMQGIINLRGRITPVLDLRYLLHDGVGEMDNFVVICRHRGLQIGLAISGVNTMYTASQSQLVFNIESEVGVSSDFLAGLYNPGDRLVNILSVDRLVEQILKSEGALNG